MIVKKGPMIRAAIFDMDGLLIDSEPLWQESEKEVFAKVDIELSTEMCLQTMGLRIDEVVEYWHSRFPWNRISKEDIANQIIAGVQKRIQKIATPMDGVTEIFQLLDSKNIPCAIASSSPKILIEAVIEKFDLSRYLTTYRSAESEPYGKPHPGIYISTAKELGIAPEHCLAFEDSFNGLLSAMSAQMKCIAVPAKEAFDDTKFDIAYVKLHSLREFKEILVRELINS